MFPKAVAADKPVILNTADSTEPQPFCPQLRVPQPGLENTFSLGKLTLDVKKKTGSYIILSAPPQPSAPNVSAHQTVS